MNININSEIGKLEGVILHRPGIEIERMTPSNAHAALYSDILNLHVVGEEYTAFENVLNFFAQTYQVKDLLKKVLENDETKLKLVVQSCEAAQKKWLAEELSALSAADLSGILIEGYPFNAAKHPQEFAHERYILKPLFNLFYTRDTASVIYQNVLIHAMASEVRFRESLILKSIFEEYFNVKSLNPKQDANSVKTEGGDFLVVSPNVLCVGVGPRTNYAGIEFLAQQLSQNEGIYHIITQELPSIPESFIHLDMVFTFLDKDQVMIYEPLILKKSGFETHATRVFTAQNGKITSREVPNLLEALKSLHIDLKPIFCGSNQDRWHQDREQWHSGANFFALGEGKVIGYHRNIRTLEAMNNAGFAILTPREVLQSNGNLPQKFVVAFGGAELPRGGGGARCMTLPVARAKTEF